MGGLFLLGVLAAIALDFHDQVERIVVPVAVVDEYDEVRDVALRLAGKAVRHLEAEVVILHVGAHAGMLLRNAAELGFPVAVEHDPVDVAAVGVRLPAVTLRRREVHVARGSGGVV